MHFIFPMRMDTAPFDDNNVRQALKHAINREEMLQKILSGHGRVGNDTPIGPSYRYFDANLEQTPYDPDKAKWYPQTIRIERAQGRPERSGLRLRRRGRQRGSVPRVMP